MEKKIYSYCLNPSCTQPKNDTKAKVCAACGTTLVLHKRFRVVKKLGKGGFGATFIGLDITLPGTPICVIKQLRPMTDDKSVFQMARQLFEREAQTLGKVGNHPQVPRLLDYFEQDQQFYLVQEYVGGNDLQKEVKKHGPYSEEGVRQFLSEILPVLDYIHSMKVIHRDIKPANIIRRDQDKKLVLIDFGAVKTQVNTMAAKNTSDQTALTQFSIGTPGFAPAEQLAMRPVYASDIYALGATCLYLLTGKSPRDLEADNTTGELTWEKYVNINPNFAAVLKKMMEVSVRNRYKNAEEVLKAMDVAPYEEMLQEGLIGVPLNKKLNKKSGGTAGSLPNSNIYTPRASQVTKQQPPSATSKLAESIRKKRRETGNTTRFQQQSDTTIGNPRTRFQTGGETQIQGNSKPKKKYRPQLKEIDVIKYMQEGRRDFADYSLSNLELKKAQLSDCDFRNSQLYKTNLQEADLTAANFYSADLEKASLRKAILSKAHLRNSNLKEADLRGADLQDANLENADLKGANLCGANLKGAKVTEKQLGKAKTNWATKLPSGKRKIKLGSTEIVI